jgi:predicted acylesterase/phospholipase RssA
MKPLRKHAALAIDGGGIRGTMVARALAIVEAELGRQCADLFEMTAGTSTGSIISATLAARIPAAEVHALYVRLGKVIFQKTLRSYWPLSGYKFSSKPLVTNLHGILGERTLGEFWSGPRPLDVIITVRDLVENRTRFLKSWKPEYQDWKLWHAVLCSSTVPTYFPVVDGRYVDGGVGSYTNPCYIAAWEATHVLKWDPKETTLISIGTGRVPGELKPGQAARFNALQWIRPLIDTFLADANDQQVRVVQRSFPGLDFRRFQVDLVPPIEIDDPAGIPALTRWGERLGQMILNDEVDKGVDRVPPELREPGSPEETRTSG